MRQPDCTTSRASQTVKRQRERVRRSSLSICVNLNTKTRYLKWLVDLKNWNSGWKWIFLRLKWQTHNLAFAWQLQGRYAVVFQSRVFAICSTMTASTHPSCLFQVLLKRSGAYRKTRDGMGFDDSVLFQCLIAFNFSWIAWFFSLWMSWFNASLFISSHHHLSGLLRKSKLFEWINHPHIISEKVIQTTDEHLASIVVTFVRHHESQRSDPLIFCLVVSILLRYWNIVVTGCTQYWSWVDWGWRTAAEDLCWFQRLANFEVIAVVIIEIGAATRQEWL